MGKIDVGVKASSTGVSGHMKGDTKDICIGFGVLTALGVAAYGAYMGVKYVYEKACKEAGLNTKDNPHNNELGPRYANKSKSGSTKPLLESKPQPTNESDGEAEAEEGKQPEWELLLRGRSDEEGEASVSMEDVENAVDPEVLQELIYQGINLIVANEKVGKTIFCMHLATALAKGERTEILPQCGIVVKQKVFYYEFENNLPIIKKHFFKRIEDVVNKGDLVLIPQAYDGEEMLEEIAKQVVKCRRTYKHLTFVIDCIYDMEVDETNELQQGLKRIYRNAMDDYGCYVTILLVQHLNDGDKVKGSKNLKRSASSIISLTPDDSNDNIVNISWKGRCVTKGSTKCIRKGPREGYEQDLHYEPYEEALVPTLQPDSALTEGEDGDEEPKSWTREKFAQPDSALPPIGVTEKVMTDEKYRLSADEFGKLHDAEKMVIYGIVKQELCNGTTGVKIAERMQERLNVKVSPTIVSTINKDTGEMRKRYADALDLDVVNKVRELYFSHNKEDKE